jgi:hypothetical protein
MLYLLYWGVALTEIISLKGMPNDMRIFLLKELGFSSDGIYVLDADGKKHYDKYINEPVKISNMCILPGSTIILDDNVFSIVSYMEEHPDVF